MRILRGQVTTGVGDFGKWITRLTDRYFRKTKLRLYPGTLNIRLEEEYRRPNEFVRLEKEEYGGTVSVSIVPCTILGLKAFILRTDKAEFDAYDHDRRTLEIATDVCLRETFGLKDGDWVEVHAP